MAIVVESTSTATTNGTLGGPSSVTITAPTGITAGDLLVIIATGNTNNFSSTGFTSVFDAGRIRVLYKYAVTADESAANYTVTTGSDSGIVAAMYRISGFTTGNPVFVNPGFAQNSVVGDLTVSRTIDVARPTQQVGFIVASVTDDDPDISDFSSPSITSSDSNPSWTKQLPTLAGGFNANDANSFDRTATCFFYAASTDTSDVTGYGYTITGANRTYDHLADVYFTIHDPQNVTGNVEAITITPATQELTCSQVNVASGVEHVHVPVTTKDIEGQATAPTQWTNETSPNTDWTNESL